VGVGDRLLLTVVPASCRVTMVSTKKSSAGNLMETTGCSVDAMCFYEDGKKTIGLMVSLPSKKIQMAQQNLDFCSIAKNYF
jgi:hypothetical protein